MAQSGEREWVGMASFGEWSGRSIAPLSCRLADIIIVTQKEGGSPQTRKGRAKMADADVASAARRLSTRFTYLSAAAAGAGVAAGAGAGVAAGVAVGAGETAEEGLENTRGASVNGPDDTTDAAAAAEASADGSDALATVAR